MLARSSDPHISMWEPTENIFRWRTDRENVVWQMMPENTIDIYTAPQSSIDKVGALGAFDDKEMTLEYER